MKIAYITGSFPSRSETFVAKQIAGIAARGHEVDVYTVLPPEAESVQAKAGPATAWRTLPLYVPGKGSARIARIAATALVDGLRAPGVMLRVVRHVVRRGLRGAPRLIVSALELVRRGRPRYDVIHAQFGPYGVFAANLVEAGAIRGPIVTSFRGYDATKNVQANLSAYRRLYRCGALFLPVSNSLAQRLVATGCGPERIRIHRSGISVAALPFAPRTGRRANVTKLITVGRLVEKKGVRYAMEAVAQVIRAGRPVHYQIVGDGPLRKGLEDLAGELGIRESVEFAGWKPHDEVLTLLADADVLIVPSVTAADGDEEGIPNVAKEAMALGLPVVATRHGGTPELIEDGVSGVLVPERDSAWLAKALIELIDHPERWAGMGEAARRRVEAEYDIDKLNDELVMLYQQVCRVDDRATRAARLPQHGTVA